MSGYQLETAARKICKAADAASVVEYEKRVNDIVLTALQLRASRRRRPAGTPTALGSGLKTVGNQHSRAI